MKGIGDFLSRYLGIRPPGEATAKALVETLQELLDATVGEGDIDVKEHVAFIRAPSVLKSEIALRKKEILARVREKVGDGLKEIR